MMYVHALAGCTPTPLAHYLKALGVLRLLCEQRDPSARGWWKDECFHVATGLDRDELLDFLVNEYAPSPMFNPWGGRSGYFAGSSERSAREALERIETAGHDRFARFRRAITDIRACLGDTKQGGERKIALLRTLRTHADVGSLPWMDVVAASLGEEVVHPPIFGTGGNEGSGSYTSAYMQAVVVCLMDHRFDGGLEACLFGDICVPNTQWAGSFGHFVPTGAASPWDLLLAFEGALVLRSSVVVRAEVSPTPGPSRWCSSPFLVAARSFGYGSSAPRDEVIINKGKTLPGRGEQWFPIWEQAAGLAEVAQLFSEGRAMKGRDAARDGYSLVRAIASLGATRGVASFVRYAYQQRNNMATHFAVPIARYRVPRRPPRSVGLLDSLDAWLPRLRREARDKHAPARLQLVERRLNQALFAVVEHPDEPWRWQAVLMALGEIEGVMVTGSGFRAGPIPRLDIGWASAADDGSAEFRLALAFARQGTMRDGKWNDDVRRHIAPLDGRRFAKIGVPPHERLASRSDVVLRGRDGLRDAIALVERRLVESAATGARHIRLEARMGEGSRLSDLAMLVAGGVDLDRVLALARPLMALDPRSAVSRASIPGPDSSWPDDAWLALRLALLPWPVGGERELDIKSDPAMYRRLSVGDAAGAFGIASRRLRGAGLYSPLRFATVDPARARLWAAALAFPITPSAARRIAARLDPSSTNGNGVLR